MGDVLGQIGTYVKASVEDARRFAETTLRGPPEARIFFLHIQKCGGTSVDGAIRRLYRSARPDGWDPVAHLQPRPAYLASKEVGMGMYSYRQQLAHYFLSNPDNRYVTGHFQVSPELVAAHEDSVDFVVLFRDPVKKWFSYYFFNKYKSKSAGRIESDIETYLGTKRARDVGCDYVQLLTGNADEETAVTRREEVQQQALDCLDRFSVAGVLERLDDFRADFREQFGRSLNILHRNPSPASDDDRERETITPEVRERVESICEPNKRIYEAVVSRLDD
ncbi:MAG: sulfotransferase family 2 domain-containing protein [Bradymonadaceae bacterium]